MLLLFRPLRAISVLDCVIPVAMQMHSNFIKLICIQ